MTTRPARKPTGGRYISLVSRRIQRGGGQPEEPVAGRVIKLDDEDVLSSILKKARSVARQPRGDDYIHVSDLLSKCTRKFALVQRHQIVDRGEPLGLQQSLTFAQGDVIHDVIKERAGMGSPGEVWGRWRCKCGNLHTDAPCLLSEVPSEECDACGSLITQYVEVSLKDEARRIVGHPDLILYLRRSKAFYITEIKSMAADRWKELVRPVPDHVLQSLFYWYLLKLSGRDIVDRVSILYVTKGHEFRAAPYKEFTYVPSKEIRRLQPYFDEAEAINAARDGGDLPLRSCATTADPDARKCPVAHLCFEDANAPKPVKFSIRQAMRSA